MNWGNIKKQALRAALSNLFVNQVPQQNIFVSNVESRETINDSFLVESIFEDVITSPLLRKLESSQSVPNFLNQLVDSKNLLNEKIFWSHLLPVHKYIGTTLDGPFQIKHKIKKRYAVKLKSSWSSILRGRTPKLSLINNRVKLTYQKQKNYTNLQKNPSKSNISPKVSDNLKSEYNNKTSYYDNTGYKSRIIKNFPEYPVLSQDILYSSLEKRPGAVRGHEDPLEADLNLLLVNSIIAGNKSIPESTSGSPYYRLQKNIENRSNLENIIVNNVSHFLVPSVTLAKGLEVVNEKLSSRSEINYLTLVPPRNKYFCYILCNSSFINVASSNNLDGKNKIWNDSKGYNLCKNHISEDIQTSNSIKKKSHQNIYLEGKAIGSVLLPEYNVIKFPTGVVISEFNISIPCKSILLVGKLKDTTEWKINVPGYCSHYNERSLLNQIKSQDTIWTSLKNNILGKKIDILSLKDLSLQIKYLYNSHDTFPLFKSKNILNENTLISLYKKNIETKENPEQKENLEFYVNYDNIVRESGGKIINAMNINSELGTTTQHIFSHVVTSVEIYSMEDIVLQSIHTETSYLYDVPPINKWLVLSQAYKNSTLRSALQWLKKYRGTSDKISSVIDISGSVSKDLINDLQFLHNQILYHTYYQKESKLENPFSETHDNLPDLRNFDENFNKIEKPKELLASPVMNLAWNIIKEETDKYTDLQSIKDIELSYDVSMGENLIIEEQPTKTLNSPYRQLQMIKHPKLDISIPANEDSFVSEYFNFTPEKIESVNKTEISKLLENMKSLFEHIPITQINTTFLRPSTYTFDVNPSSNFKVTNDIFNNMNKLNDKSSSKIKNEQNLTSLIKISTINQKQASFPSIIIFKKYLNQYSEICDNYLTKATNESDLKFIIYSAVRVNTYIDKIEELYKENSADHIPLRAGCIEGFRLEILIIVKKVYKQLEKLWQAKHSSSFKGKMADTLLRYTTEINHSAGKRFIHSAALYKPDTFIAWSKSKLSDDKFIHFLPSRKKKNKTVNLRLDLGNSLLNSVINNPFTYRNKAHIYKKQSLKERLVNKFQSMVNSVDS